MTEVLSLNCLELLTDHNGYYTRGNLLDFNNFKENYKTIAIDLSKQIELENKDLKQQINFIGSLDRTGGATMFFIIEKQEETVIEFFAKLCLYCIKWKVKR